MTLAFEQVSCLFGHTAPAEKLFERPDWWLGLPGDFAWRRCSECGLLFLSPRPSLSTIATYYPPEYAAYSPAIDDERWPWMRWKRRRNLRPQVTAVNRYAAYGRLLDVGCATGNYLAEMRRHGWEVQGIELQAAAAAYARARFNLEVFTGDLLDSRLPGNHFDAVTMWNVLEHTHDPLTILREVHRLLKPGGLVVFSIPDPDSKEARAFGPAWIGYDAPRHLYLFHDASLDRLLVETGFALLAKQHSLATYHTWIASWHTQLNRRQAATTLRRLLVKGAYLPFWPTLTAPYFHWLNKSGRGSIVTIYAHARSTT
jgi:SAM-dependent methyltransferase